MTWDEFDGTWFPAHKAAFTGIQEFFRRQTTGTEAPSYDAVLKGWFQTLRDVDLATAMEATRAMARGDIDEPVGYDRHPRAIRKAAGISYGSRKRPWDEPRYDADGTRTYACLLCMDDGFVICWHPTAMQAAIDGTLGNRFTLTKTAILCTCEAGRARGGRTSWPRFDSKLYLPLQRIEGGREVIGCPANQSEQERLINWMKTREPVRSENYEAAFGDNS